jgi:hypothetical protein
MFVYSIHKGDILSKKCGYGDQIKGKDIGKSV